MHPGAAFPLPFTVSVYDESDLPANGIPVLFSVMAGDGHLDGEVIRQVMTGPDGVAAVRWTAGPYWGPENILQATVVQNGQEIEGTPVRWSFAAPAVDPDSSTLTATSPVSADGETAALITVTLKTPAGLSCGAGYTVKLSVQGNEAQLVQSDTLTDAAGRIHAALTATSAGERKITALVKGLEVTLSDTALVQFDAKEPNHQPQILGFHPPQSQVPGYYDQSLDFSLSEVVDEDGDSLFFRWLVNGVERSLDHEMSFIPTVPAGKDYEVIAWVSDGEDSTFIRWQVAVTVTGLCEERGKLPKTLRLRQNYPNPFNPATQIVVEIPAAQNTSVRIYNVKGQRVRMLQEGLMTPGYHALYWDARNDAGLAVPSGVYHAVLKTEDACQVIRLLLMK